MITFCPLCDPFSPKERVRWVVCPRHVHQLGRTPEEQKRQDEREQEWRAWREVWKVP